MQRLLGEGTGQNATAGPGHCWGAKRLSARLKGGAPRGARRLEVGQRRRGRGEPVSRSRCGALDNKHTWHHSQIWAISKRWSKQPKPKAMSPPKLLFNVIGKIDPAQPMAGVGVGSKNLSRGIFPYTGGSFEGPAGKGTVLAGGGDYGLVDGAKGNMELDIRIHLLTDDGVPVYGTCTGRWA